jgi:hypothetical protein
MPGLLFNCFILTLAMNRSDGFKYASNFIHENNSCRLGICSEPTLGGPCNVSRQNCSMGQEFNKIADRRLLKGQRPDNLKNRPLNVHCE